MLRLRDKQMITLLSGRTEVIQRFHANPWPVQQTFKTPLKDLKKFVSVFLNPFSLEKGVLSTDEVVFEPKHLVQLLAKHSVQVENAHQLTVKVEGQQAISNLLEIESLSIKADNILAKGLSEETLSAANREINGGMGIYKGGNTGELFNHPREVREGLRGMANVERQAQKMLKNSKLSPEAKAIIQGVLDRAQKAIQAGQKAITISQK